MNWTKVCRKGNFRWTISLSNGLLRVGQSKGGRRAQPGRWRHQPPEIWYSLSIHIFEHLSLSIHWRCDYKFKIWAIRRGRRRHQPPENLRLNLPSELPVVLRRWKLWPSQSHRGSRLQKPKPVPAEQTPLGGFDFSFCSSKGLQK